MGGVRMLRCCTLSGMALGHLLLMAVSDVGFMLGRGGGVLAQAYQVIPNDFKVSNAFGPFAPGNYVKIVHRNPKDAVASGVPESMGLAWGAVTSRKDAEGREIKKAIVRNACTQGELTKYGFEAHDGMGYFKQTFTDTNEEKGKIKALLSVEGMSIDRTEHGGEFAAVIEVTNQHASKSLRLWFYDQRHRTMLGSGKKRMAGSVGNGELSITPLGEGENFNASKPYCLNAGSSLPDVLRIRKVISDADMTSGWARRLARSRLEHRRAHHQSCDVGESEETGDRRRRRAVRRRAKQVLRHLHPRHLDQGWRVGLVLPPLQLSLGRSERRGIAQGAGTLSFHALATRCPALI